MKQARGRWQQSSGTESLRESSPSRSNCSCRKPYTPAAVTQTKHLNLYQPLPLPTLPSIFPYANPTSSATTRKTIPETARRGTFRNISPASRTRHAKPSLKLSLAAPSATFPPVSRTRHATKALPLRVVVSATGSSSGDSFAVPAANKLPASPKPDQVHETGTRKKATVERGGEPSGELSVPFEL